MITQEVIEMNNIEGKYFVRLEPNFGFILPGCSGSYFQFWTNNIKYEDDGSITFSPLNVYSVKTWPAKVNIHISNCVVFTM